jgi:hypothetical protein
VASIYERGNEPSGSIKAGNLSRVEYQEEP